MPQTEIPYILSLLTFLPLVGALVVMCLPRPKDLPEAHGDSHAPHDAHDAAPVEEDPSRTLVNWTALAFAALNFLLSLALFAAFKVHHIDTSKNCVLRVGGSIWW